MTLYRLRVQCDILVEAENREEALNFTDQIPEEVGGYEFKPQLLREVETIDDLPPGWVRDSIPYGDGPRKMLWQFPIRGLNDPVGRTDEGGSLK